MENQVHRVLTSEVGVPMETARLIAMLPTTSDPDELLLTDEEWCPTLWSALLAAPMQTDAYAQPSVAMNRCRTTPDNAYTLGQYGISELPATQYHALPASSGQQKLITAKGIVALCVSLVVIGASFAAGGVLPGVLVLATVGTAVVGIVTKCIALW